MAPWQEWEWRSDPNAPDGEWMMTFSYPGRPDIVWQACQQPISEDDPSPRVPCTLEEVEMAFTRSDMTSQDPWVAMGRLGLQIVQPEEPVAEDIVEPTSEPLL